MLDEGRRIEVETGEGPAAAEAAGLSFVSDDMDGITRRARGKSFRYELPSGAVLRDRIALARIRKLAIPPAWTDVCYVHPGIIECYLDGTLGKALGETLKRQRRRTPGKRLAGLQPQEAATLALLQARLDADIAVRAGNPSAPQASANAR